MSDGISEVGSKFKIQAKNALQGQQTHVKDANLQIHVPTVGEGFNVERTNTFRDILSDYLDEVNTLQHEADAQIQRLVAGETEDLHEVTMAMDEAEASFELMMEIRNKLVDAYRELMRMQ